MSGRMVCPWCQRDVATRPTEDGLAARLRRHRRHVGPPVEDYCEGGAQEVLLQLDQDLDGETGQTD